MSASLVYLTRLVNFQRTAGLDAGGEGAPAPVLEWREQPDSGEPGQANAVSVAVVSGAASAVAFQVRDAGNEPVGLATVVVPEGGIAAFGFANPAAGRGYAVSAADVDGRARLVLSGRFDVRPKPVVRTLAFSVQPVSGQEGSPGTAAVSVSNVSAVVFRLTDAGGAPVASSAPVPPANGAASWAFTYPRAGAGYRVLAEATDDPAVRALSDPFDATPAPQTLPAGAFAADGSGAVLLDGDGHLIPV